MTAQIVRKNTGLLKAFGEYKKRFLNVGKKPNITKLLPEVLFRTMRLEGEKVTRKEARSLFK
jgi:hypothetical protein